LQLAFRVKFILIHPIKSFLYLISDSEDYSKIETSEIAAFLRDPKVIIEAGAADGTDTKIFSDYFPMATIYAVEPVKEQFHHLQRTLKFQENVHLWNYALSDRDELAQIYLGKEVGNLGGRGSSSLLKPSKHKRYFPRISFEEMQDVQGIKLSSFVQDLEIEMIDLLWLDIQGKELDVLRASADLMCQKVFLLHLEISNVELYKGMPKSRDIYKFLKLHGFMCVIDRVGAISGNALFLNTKI